MASEESKQKTRQYRKKNKATIQRVLSEIDNRFDGRADKTSKYTDTEIINAVSLYRIYNNVARVSEITSIPQSTIASWLSGDSLVLSKIGNLQERIEESYQNLIANNLYLMSKAQQQINDRIGDASAAQAATIYGILSDKTQMMMNRKEDTNVSAFVIAPNSLSQDEQTALLQRVLNRKAEAEAIEADYTVEGNDEG